MTEKRASKRLAIDIPVTCRILCDQKKKKISHEINSKAYNLSDGGAYIAWPKSWDCETCSNCLAWVFNYDCDIKKKKVSYQKNFNRCLTTSNFLQLEFDSPQTEEPVKLKAKVAWVKPEEENDEYKVGLSFLKGEEHKLKKLRIR